MKANSSRRIMPTMKAEHWSTAQHGRIQCLLCPHGCVLGEGKTGLCRVRTVKGGELLADGYGLVSSAGLDPIEKKPLYHFHPGSMIFSVGGWGCNFACSFCQNWAISQRLQERSDRVRPADLVRAAAEEESIGVAYTYNEPLTGFEFTRDCAAEARRRGLANVLVTNGFVREHPAAQLLPLIDALNIDVKSMDDAFYRTHCHGRLEPVLAFARQAREAGCHVEITNLLIPGQNDRDDLIVALAEWVRATLGPETPLHLSAYRPMYKMDVPATPAVTLLRAREICGERLTYVYLGNLAAGAGNDTVCPDCRAVLVKRQGYRTRRAGLEGGACLKCGRRADLIL